MNQKSYYQAFIFDLDGTLLSTIEDIADSVNYALSEHGLETISYEECTHCIGDGSVLMLQRAMHHCHEDLFPSVFDTYYKDYVSHPCRKSKPYAGLVDALLYAKSKGILLFVYTNKPQDIALQAIDICFGKNMFERMVGIPLGGKVKPDPEAFFAVGKEFDLDYSRCAYFGDSVTDLLTAKNLGIKNCYSVLWGYQNKEKLLTSLVQPKTYLSDPEQIRMVVDNIL